MLAHFGLRQVGTLPRRSQRLTVERDKPIAARVADSLFMHAGINPSRPVPNALADVISRARNEIRRIDAHRQRLANKRLALATALLAVARGLVAWVPLALAWPIPLLQEPIGYAFERGPATVCSSARSR